jgi:hypothetical protein
MSQARLTSATFSARDAVAGDLHLTGKLRIPGKGLDVAAKMEAED